VDCKLATQVHAGGAQSRTVSVAAAGGVPTHPGDSSGGRAPATAAVHPNSTSPLFQPSLLLCDAEQSKSAVPSTPSDPVHFRRKRSISECFSRPASSVCCFQPKDGCQVASLSCALEAFCTLRRSIQNCRNPRFRKGRSGACWAPVGRGRLASLLKQRQAQSVPGVQITEDACLFVVSPDPNPRQPWRRGL
jgi:hypothetical protein